MIELVYAPIDDWPADSPITCDPSPFSANYGRTLELLERELDHLAADNVRLLVALRHDDIRLDGRPRARAVAEHPGVVLSFESRYGPLRYATGKYATWQDNLRAIALSLEALRKVDRYGVSRRGEQYRGWKQIEAASSDGGSLAEARRLVRMHGSVRHALGALHPDNPETGDADAFRLVNEHRSMIEEVGS